MLLFLCLLLFIPNITADCPSGSVSWLSKCYSFLTTPQNFSDAESSCNNQNGHLISIHESFTNSFIYNKGNSLFSKDFNMTIGLNCTFGNCSWTDGTPFDYNDFSFPSNQTGCGTMSLATGYWNIENCFYKRFYVCQVPENVVVSTPPPTTTTSKATASQATATPSISTSLCPSDDWLYFNETNSCYYWTSAFDWASAEAFCVGEYAHLASVHSSTELNFLKFIYNGDVWIGLHADKGPIELNSKWQWTDGSYLDYLPWSGTFGLPTLGYNYSCVRTYGNTIYNTDCSTVITGICKKSSTKIISTTSSPPVSKCQPGWTYYKGNNLCYFGPLPALTQNVAEKSCASMGGHLPSIHSLYELQFLFYTTLSKSFWIGLYTTDSPVQLNTTWQWTDKTAVNYLPWYNVIPSLDNKLCAISQSNSFQNTDCSASYITICQQLPLDSTPTSSPVSTTTVKPPSLCNNVFTYSNYFIPLAMMNWTTAEEFCELCGAYLASFHSLNEISSFASYVYRYGPLKNQYGANYWTGLYSDNNGRTWKWNDGSPYDFSYWYPGYPNQKGEPTATLYISSSSYIQYGMTNNLDFTTKLYAICKRY
jgi:hypothetical protein